MKHLYNILKYSSSYNYDFLFRHLIHPYSFLFVSDYYYGPPMTYKALKYVPYFSSKTISNYKPFSVIFVDSLLFKDFVQNILDLLPYPIILISGREVLPQIEDDNISQYALNHPKIAAWFAQNPIYDNNEKYFAIPYGIRPSSFQWYFNSLVCDLFREKNIYVSNLPTTAHDYLDKNHVRIKYPILGEKTGCKLPAHIFYNTVARSQFVISPPGDRQDCYRHYECIGLGALPISNISDYYKNIFYDSMVFTTTEELVDIASGLKTPNISYNEPNRDMICTNYYFNIFHNIIQKFYE